MQMVVVTVVIMCVDLLDNSIPSSVLPYIDVSDYSVLYSSVFCVCLYIPTTYWLVFGVRRFVFGFLFKILVLVFIFGLVGLTRFLTLL